MRRAAAALALAAALGPSAAGAAGWTQAEGAFYAKAWARYISGAKGYLADGESGELGGTVTDVAFNVYGEYGLTDDVTLVAFATPYGHASFDPDGASTVDLAQHQDSVSYMGPLKIGVRHALHKGTANVAVEFRYGYAPAVGDEALISTGPPLNAEYRPAVETHRADMELQLGVGLPWGLWTSATAGLTSPFGGETLDTAFVGGGQLGWSGPWGLVIDAHAVYYAPLGEVTESQVAGTGQTRYLGTGFGLSWWFLDRLGVNAGIDGATMVESNFAAAPITFGVEAR